ncbi:similar to RIKEN cDNA 1110031B06 [Rattus norvegicus]|uniref:Uncharacterized protein n=1 Tax=Rattus norvegicus TaxID=10116 RepID=A6HF10_RAT|nr:similar to RIKEN cDNA 1110031B06 [Rattus norvegicus]
MQLWMASP